jgi:hypothetical protein
MEEGLAKGSNLVSELKMRSRYAPVMDLYDACRDTPGTDAIFDPDRGFRQPVWRAVAFLMASKAGGRTPSLGECNRRVALRVPFRNP